MAISTEFGLQAADLLNVTDIGKIGYPACQRGLQDLFTAVYHMRDLKMMQWVETKLLNLPEIVRRLFSHFGAVRGYGAGHLWRIYSYDATNVVYASVWELWKLEERSGRFPYCRSITNVNIAGNIVEALLGIAWILSTNRQAIRWKPVVWGVTLQLILGVILLSPELQQFFFSAVDLGVKKLLSFSEAGADFVFQAVEPHQIVDASGDSVFWRCSGLEK